MKDLKDFLKVVKTDSEIFKKQYEQTESDECLGAYRLTIEYIRLLEKMMN